MFRTNQKKLPKFILAFFIIMLLIFLTAKGFLDPLRNVFGYIFTGGSGKARDISVNTKDLTVALFNLGQFIEENKEAEEIGLKNKILEEEALELKKENENLRKQLELLPKSPYDLIMAEVIFQDPNSADKIIVINKGSKNGVEKGMPVIIQDKILVGEVYAVETNRSFIILSVSLKNAFDVALAEEQKTVGIAQGRYHLEIILDLIPNSAKLEKGQSIITAGKNSNFPPGLLVGEITNVNQSPDGLFKQAVIKPFYSSTDLGFVFLIKR